MGWLFMQFFKAPEAVTVMGANDVMVQKNLRMNRRLIVTRLVLILSIIINVKLIFG